MCHPDLEQPESNLDAVCFYLGRRLGAIEVCGILGFLGNGKADAILAGKMAAQIAHRDSGDAGVWLAEEVGLALGHHHLSTANLPLASHQPVQSQCRRYVLVCNGQIYNHLDLRRELESAGEAPMWREHSNIETLLACFAAWGIERTLRSTIGMFALALWDAERQVLTLARDRLGEKPLYWGWQSGVLLFGSKLKALKMHPAFKAEVSRDALALLLRYNYIPTPHSIYCGIHKLPAGHFLSIPLGKSGFDARPRPYWSMKEVIERGLTSPFSGSDNEAVDALEQQLSESVAGQMSAEVPLGAFLSGGVDSSTIVALMQKQSGEPVRTFAIGFDEPGYDEAGHAKAVAQHLGANHTELYVSAADALVVIPKLPHIYCEPLADSSQIPTYLASRMAGEHLAVALSGDAGDELFGGYNPYQFGPRIWQAISRVPVPVRSMAARLLRSDLPLPEKLRKLAEVLPARSREDFYLLLMSHWRQPESLVLGASGAATIFNSPSAWPSTDSFAHWMMAVDAQQYMVDDVLVKVESAATANGLETRVPMLDHRVVELAWRLPLALKIRNGKGKWVLREVLYRYVSKELIDRPKKGFSIPSANWLRGPLRDWAESLLEETRLRQEGYFNPVPIRRAWLEHLAARTDHSARLWSVLMFQAWLEAQRG